MTAFEAAKERLSEAKKVPLIGLIQELGYKLDSNGAYFSMLSPFRSEAEPSFKIDKRRPNKWRDHGNGKHGDVVDFVEALLGYSRRDAINYLLGKRNIEIPTYEKPQNTRENIEIISVSSIESPWLIDYIHFRQIPLHIARFWLSELEIRFPNGKNPDRVTRVVGFKNDSGGYEMRSKSLKIGNRPKNITTIRGRDNSYITLYEGFFNFLTNAMKYRDNIPPTDVIVLNSLSFLPAIIPFIKDKKILSYLDNDRAGNESTKLLKAECTYVRDMRYLYLNFNDLNDELRGIRKTKTIRQILGKE